MKHETFTLIIEKNGNVRFFISEASRRLSLKWKRHSPHEGENNDWSCCFIFQNLERGGIVWLIVRLSQSSLVCVCVFVLLFCSMWAQELRRCCMCSSISCPLLSAIHNSLQSQRPSLLLLLFRLFILLLSPQSSSSLVRCPWRWFSSVTTVETGSMRGPGQPQRPSGVVLGGYVMGAWISGRQAGSEVIRA